MLRAIFIILIKKENSIRLWNIKTFSNIKTIIIASSVFYLIFSWKANISYHNYLLSDLSFDIFSVWNNFNKDFLIWRFLLLIKALNSFPFSTHHKYLIWNGPAMSCTTYGKSMYLLGSELPMSQNIISFSNRKRNYRIIFDAI